MASKDEEDGDDDLFEGMVLINSSQQIDDPSTPNNYHQPLDENLFSDLTLVVNQTLTLEPEPEPEPEPKPKTTIDAAPSLKQIPSRRKKRGAVRIGYGREEKEPDDSDSSFLQSPLVSENPPPSIDFHGTRDSFPSHLRPSPSEIPIPEAELSSQAALVSDNGAIPLIKEVVEEKEEEEEEAAAAAAAEAEGGFIEEKLEMIRIQLSEKLERIREQAASVSVTRKEAARIRRKASENLNLASVKYKELEKELEDACEAEDFERAERVSECLAAVEKDKEEFLNALRNAESECNLVDSKMQEVLELQIRAEEEGVESLEQFAKDSADSADLVLRNAEELSSKQMEHWLSLTEAVDIKKMELGIQSDLINDARFGLKDFIEGSIEDDRKQKDLLSEKRDMLTEELDELLVLVRQKEAEIAETNSNIQEVERRISSVVSGYSEAQTSIDKKYDDLQAALSRIESESEALSSKKKEFDESLALAEDKSKKLGELASFSADEARTCQELVGLRKSLASSILKSREDKVRLAKTEEKISEDVQVFRHQISAARASLQELSSTRASIQQEIASSKQRIIFIDKRGPELEAEKKVAAAARNFKEAGRIAAEAKTLSLEKESEQDQMQKAVFELEKLDQEIMDTVNKLQETEGLILSKEKEAAMAGCERLRLVAAAAMAERSAALEFGDLEEANILLAEAEAAEYEATKLQQAYGFEAEVFGKMPKHLISMALITKLAGKQLSEMAASASLSAE